MKINYDKKINNRIDNNVNTSKFCEKNEQDNDGEDDLFVLQYTYVLYL